MSGSVELGSFSRSSHRCFASAVRGTEGEDRSESRCEEGRSYGLPSGAVDTSPHLELQWGYADDLQWVWLPASVRYASFSAGANAAATADLGFGVTTMSIQDELCDTEHLEWTANALGRVGRPQGDLNGFTDCVGAGLRVRTAPVCAGSTDRSILLRMFSPVRHWCARQGGD